MLWWLGALAALVARLPWRALGIPGSVLGWLAGSIFRIRRAHVEDAMRAGGVPQPSREARAMYRALGRSAFEFLWLSRRGAEAVQHVAVHPSSDASWRAVLARGRGAVLAASHTGNWDLAAVATARDVELLVVTKHLRAPALDRFWQSTRAGRGVRLTGAQGAMLSARGVLRRGGAVAMMIDQVPSSPRHALGVEFLGRRALADRSPAVLAAATGAPLVVVAGRADGKGEHLLHVLAVLDPPARSRRAGPRTAGREGQDAWVAEATAASARALDAFVRAYPSQWLWMHRRWADRCGVDRAARAATLDPPCSRIRSSSPDAASRAG